VSTLAPPLGGAFVVGISGSMDSKPLVVRVEDIATRQAWQYVFDGGPVWVGCGAEASLVIVRPFISLQHGCFRFDNQSIQYQDLDPGVGTIVDGNPAGTREVPLTEWSQLEMGDLRVTVSRRPPEGPVLDPSLSPFVRPLRALDAAPPTPALPRTLVLPDARIPSYQPPAPGDAWSEIVDPESTPEPAHRTASHKPARRRRRTGRVKRAFRRTLLWLLAVLVGAAILGVAGMLLQYRGLSWMPPQLAARVPTWLANLFR
jgi:hypothetical protein